MSGPDVPPDEMVNFPWPGERAGAMPTQDLQALLNGPSSSGEDDGWATLAGLLRAVAAPGRAEELAGLAAAVAVFRHERDGISPVHRRDEARRTTMLSTFMSSRTTVAAFAAAAVGVSATAAAACTGALPEPIKRTAYRILGASGLQQAQPVPDPLPTNSAGSAPARIHRAVGAAAGTVPAEDPEPTPTPTPTGSTGAPVARVLCVGWAAHDAEPPDSTAFRWLAQAAGGPEKVTLYCATVTARPAKPGKPTRVLRPSPPSEATEGTSGNSQGLRRGGTGHHHAKGQSRAEGQRDRGRPEARGSAERGDRGSRAQGHHEGNNGDRGARGDDRERGSGHDRGQGRSDRHHGDR
jgi:hypothetical protein